jgi:hypothetical protein
MSDLFFDVGTLMKKVPKMKTHVGQQQGFHLCLRPLLRLSQEPVFNATLKNYVEMSPLLIFQYINIQSAVLPRCRIRNICPSSQLVFIDPDTGPTLMVKIYIYHNFTSMMNRYFVFLQCEKILFSINLTLFMRMNHTI